MKIVDAQWIGLNVARVEFTNLTFESGSLQGVRFEGSKLTRVTFQSRYDADVPEFSEAIGLDAYRPDLNMEEAEFFQSELNGVSFDRVRLDSANFQQVQIKDATSSFETDHRARSVKQGLIYVSVLTVKGDKGKQQRRALLYFWNQ